MIVILDGNSIAYRAYHKSPPLTAPDGTPTGTVHIFFTILNSVKKQLNPSKIIAVFDAKGDTTRHKLYPEYKANRDAMPEDLAPQIRLIQEILSLAGVPVYSKVGIEADDIIATLAKVKKTPVTIVTKDKDLFQLVNDTIKIYDDQTGKLLGIEETKIKYGVAPSQILSYLSLIGDKSDNIPGVAGVGVKTAEKLINEYGSLDEIYDHINDFKGKLKENLIRDKECAYLAQTLINLHDVEMFEPILTPNEELLKDKLLNLGMRTILSRLLGEEGSTANDDDNTTLKPVTLGEVKAPTLLLYEDEKVLVSDNKTFETYDPAIHKINKNTTFYDIKEIIKYVDLQGIDLKNAKDHLLISWLCEPDIGAIRKSRNEPIEEFIPRIYHMGTIFEKQIEKLELADLYKNLELQVAYILADMELVGVKIDPTKVQNTANDLTKRITVVLSRFIQRANYEINMNSPKQVSEYLYDHLKISPLSKTKRSTAEDVLKELLLTYPEHKDILEDILLYREYSKLLSTYTQPLLDSIGEDGRIHTTYRQTGTGTGRLSSVAPNLQNIPVRGDIGKTIRNAFVPKEGYTFVSLDYSQIELRILAHLSNDPELIKAFEANEDIHSITAMKIFGLTEEEVDNNSRRLAKAVNFGVIYGLSPFGLSRDVGVSPKEARDFIDAYFSLYKNVKTYISDTITSTRDKGYCETLLGRKRFFPDINSRNGLNRQRAERAAMNAPIQGAAADIIKLAMIDCTKLISDKKYDAKLCLQIHDELIFEVNNNQLSEFIPKIQSVMEKTIKLAVPLSANVSSGQSWGELQ